MGRVVISDQFFSVTQLAARWAVSDDTVRRWIASGRLAGKALGGTTYRVKREDVEAFESSPEKRPKKGRPSRQIVVRARFRDLSDVR